MLVDRVLSLFQKNAGSEASVLWLEFSEKG